MSELPTVLIVDDEEQERSFLAAVIQSFGYRVVAASNGEEALAQLDVSRIDVIVTDLVMPKVDGRELLRTLLERGDGPPVIVLTAFGTVDEAVSTVHDLRAFWFLEKPAQPAMLRTLIERAAEYGRMAQETERLKRELSYQGVLGEMVGDSPVMRQIYTVIQRVAPTQASVLVTGESGTGKEVVARTIHRLSLRDRKPFVAVNCAALPADLIESELFGHEKGAFTGAVARRAGCFEQADGGTLLLDEIGEMPLAMQARLLRVLEESCVRRLGATGEVPVDVRVIAATNRSVEDAVNVRSLREDLFYRLNVFRIHLPPLRNRKEDIPALAMALLRDLNQRHECKVTGLHRDTIDRLRDYSWPGNVRELRNVMEWAVVTTREGDITASQIPKHIRGGPSPVAQVPQQAGAPSGSGLAVGRSLKDIEKDYIMETLQATGYNRTETARILGISLRTLYNRLSALSISLEHAKDTGMASHAKNATH